MSPCISIIIVSYNTAALLRQCLASIAQQDIARSYEVIVVDNHSDDGSVEMVQAAFPTVRLIQTGRNLGFGNANNLGAEAARGEALFLLNSDAVLLEDSLSPLYAHLQSDPQIAAVGPRVLLRSGKDQPKTWGYLPTLWRLWNQSSLLCRLLPHSRFFAGVYVEAQWSREMEAGWISGVCMMISKDAFLEIGGFSPEFFMYAEDVDLCRRLKERGHRIIRLHDHAIQHLCGGSSKTEQQILRHRVMQQRNFLLLCRKTGSRWQAGGSKILLTGGLLLRSTLQRLGSLAGRPSPRQEQRAHRACLRDLFLPGQALPGDRQTLRIGLDAHLLGAGKGGAERQIANFAYWLPRLQPAVEWHFFIRSAYEPPPALCHPQVTYHPLKERNLLVSRLVILPWRAFRHRLDLLHTQCIAPLFCPAEVAVTIHDVLPLTAPADHRTLRDVVVRLLTGPTIRKSQTIFTVSKAAREEIVQRYPAASSKVQVVSNGIDHYEQQSSPSGALEPSVHLPASLRHREYLLYFGAVMERKNLEVLLAGYLQYQGSPCPPLVFAGMVRDPVLLQRLQNEVRRAKAEERVLFLGAKSERERVALFRSARLFLAPSRGEGFDLPPVEALSYGVPVLASGIAVHREVLKDAATYFEVDSPASVARQLELILEGSLEDLPSLKRRRAIAGLYTWQQAATRCLAGYFQRLPAPSSS